MFVENLHLELTRNCTLHCEHCLRGEKECINMHSDIIDKVFENVTKIHSLVLTGGEPFIAMNELEHLIEVIKRRNIKVKKIYLITNGTIMSARVLRILKELNQIGHLSLSLSSDIFHKLEVERQEFVEIVEENRKTLKQFFRVKEYASRLESIFRIQLSCEGRAASLTQARLAEINRIGNTHYVIKPGVRTLQHPDTFIKDNSIYGCIYVDVYGNIVRYGESFLREDYEASIGDTNIIQLGFEESARNFVEKYGPKKEDNRRLIFKK